MPKLTKHCTDRLNKVPLSGLLPVEGTGSTLHGKCPKCGKSGKIKSKWQGLYVVDNDRSGKHYAGCTSCSFKAGGGAINVMMKFHDVTFPQACEMISNQTGIELEYEQEPVSRKNTMQPAPQPDARSFCMQQLTASGLTLDDVRAKVLIDGVETVISPFQKGCIDIMTGKIDNLADEMLILYYDIEGRRKTFIPSKNKTKEMPYGRNRWANPDAHPDKSGKPIKYQTPYGAKGSEFYIPQKIRTKYKNHIDIPTLYIQEGEKKAEKACKHGIDSIAIQGISNTGRKEEGLPPELQYLVKRCNIQKIVFLMDADWNEISTNITDGSFIDTRPKAFARAVIKFKKYVGTLNQCGLFVDIWYAHINKNIAGDKGIDDLLCNTLHGREHLFLEDISRAMEAHDGKGTYADIMNITSWSDSKIMDLWSLNNKDDFFERHRERLLSLHSFRFSDVAYKIEDGKIIADSEFGCGQDFWSSWHEEKNGRIKKHVEIDLVYLKAWLHANGFRVRIGEDGKPSFLRIEGGIVKAKHEILIRRFVLDHVNKSTKDHDIHVYMAENIANKLSLPNLCQLDMIDEISVRDPYTQTIFFSNAEVKISDRDIIQEKLIGPVWEENVVKRQFNRIPIFSEFRLDNSGTFRISLTNDGRNCEFLRFLINTSNHFGRFSTLTPEMQDNLNWHLANKITAIGYLLRDYKYLNETKAVVSMDANMTEVGKSEGRTGKSLIGKALEKFVCQTEIDGRNTTNDDQYIFSGVTRRTRTVFLDDIKQNFDIGRFYQRIAGNLNVNIKQGARFYIQYEDAPKFLISTNHSLENLDKSALARIIFMSFSPWYSDAYTPRLEFGHNFFQEWDEYQWSLFDNLMLECLMYYMRSHENGWGGPGLGAVNPPMDNLRRRELRQKMGETFLQWAELYFAPDAGNLNSRIIRKTLTDRYIQDNDLRMITPQSFREKMEAFCEYSGLHLNATRQDKNGMYYIDFIKKYPGKSFIGTRDASGGTEYFSVTTTQFNKSDI